MKIPCSVIRDLLPLYAEKLVETETENLVAEHLADCSDCRQRLSTLNEYTKPAIEATKPLLNLKKQIIRRRWRAAAIAALCVFVLLFTAFYHTNKVQHVEWKDGLIDVKGVETITPEDRNGRTFYMLSKLIPAPEKYTGEALILKTLGGSYGIMSNVYPDGDGSYTVVLQMYTTKSQLPDLMSIQYAADPELSQLGRFQENNEEYNEVVIYPVPDHVIYGYGSSQRILWGEPLNGGLEVLPRLALAYYLLFAGVSAAVFGLLWLILRGKKAGIIMRQIFFAPAAYMMAHILLKGMETTSYFMGRELFLILMIAIALYFLFTLAWQVWLQRRKEH